MGNTVLLVQSLSEQQPPLIVPTLSDPCLPIQPIFHIDADMKAVFVLRL